MTESRLQAENKELREQNAELNALVTAKAIRNNQLENQRLCLREKVEDLINENQRLVDTIFEKQAIIDELEKTE